MSPSEVEEFRHNPHFADAVRLRQWDDRAKVVGLPTPPFAHFRRYAEAVARGSIS
jgi:[1-hydroxy-2-(trimethylamino)ethyl]phosphonate dioxygenase